MLGPWSWKFCILSHHFGCEAEIPSDNKHLTCSLDGTRRRLSRNKKLLFLCLGIQSYRRFGFGTRRQCWKGMDRLKAFNAPITLYESTSRLLLIFYFISPIITLLICNLLHLLLYDRVFFSTLRFCANWRKWHAKPTN